MTRLSRLLAYSVVWWLGACAHIQGDLRYIGTPQTVIEYPPPPNPARYRYVGELRGEPNFARQGGRGWSVQRVLAWLVGLGKGRQQLLQRPQSGWVDQRGRIFVTDSAAHVVWVFDPAEGQLEQWQTAGDGGSLITPVGIVGDNRGHIWVADADQGQVSVLSEDGKPLGVVGRGALQRPTGVALDPRDGRLFVADSQAHQILIFDARGVQIAATGQRGVGPGQFNGPTHLAFAHDRLHVVDTLNSRVQILDRDGAFQHQFGRRGLYVGDLPRPKGVSVDSDGNVYVVESYYDYLLVYNAQGRPLLPIGGTGTGVGQFYLPTGVWTDSRDHIYVADMFNRRIVVLRYLRSSDDRQNARQGQQSHSVGP